MPPPTARRHANDFLLDDQVEGDHGEKLIAGVAVEEQGDVVGGEDLAGDGIEDEHGGGAALKEALVLPGDGFKADLHVVLGEPDPADEMVHQQEEQRGGEQDEENPLPV